MFYAVPCDFREVEGKPDRRRINIDTFAQSPGGCIIPKKARILVAPHYLLVFNQHEDFLPASDIPLEGSGFCRVAVVDRREVISRVVARYEEGDRSYVCDIAESDLRILKGIEI